MYDGINPVQELGATGASASLLTGLGVDEYYRRTDAAGPRDMVTDALGSVLGLADGAGQVRTTYRYEPYGATTVQGEASANSFQYTGRENDGTGLYYYRARYYHPGLGRFVAEDPIGLAGGINAYTYVEGDPISFIDPLGLCPMCIVPALPYIPEAIVVGATWWASQQVINQNKTPNAGEPGSWHTNPGSGQERKYGPDGRPELDIDWDHDHGQGSPHGHNWNNGKRDDGWPISPWPPGRKPNTCQAK
ncbi:RHS repeat-associated core domain-containing protein [Noviherbaspirillum soli]|uniref:RHS repeat-associated core domain-containing protein n=1 Tax=Noviherbaspirillum soli TaxID=1064518 RepID=UPI00188C7CD7|nr:RHS repeat-associated core domain-containing protein [Noviherbaspirillum soli]